jgi:hypothetical protein
MTTKNERLRKLLLYQEYVTFCLKRELGLTPSEDDMEERMLKWFEYSHLPEHLQVVSRPFAETAKLITEGIESGPERTVALRKLLEAKDAAVRAKLTPGG